MLAMSHVHLGASEKALQFFEAAHEAKPEDTVIGFQYGLLCCQRGLYDPAEKLLGKVTDMEQNADAECNMGRLKLVKYDDKDAAIIHFATAKDRHAEHLLAHTAITKLKETEEKSSRKVIRMEQSTIYDDIYITGEVERVIFMSEQTRFAVLKVNISETNTHFNDEAIVTGYFHAVSEGDSYRFSGKITNHARYGEQFSADSFKKEMPNTIRGVIQYLSGDTFPGIGEKTAGKIVEALGVDALEKISDDASVLKDVGGLSKSKMEMIHRTILENRQTEQSVIKLTELGFGPRMSAKILKTYQD